MPQQDEANGGSRAASQDLGRLWSEWTRMVDDVARRQKRAYRLTDQHYAELHDRLMAAIRQQVDRCKSSRKTLFREMLALAGPWVSLDSLADAERHVLMVLVAQCRRVEKRLYGRGEARRWIAVAAPVLIAVAAGVAAVVVVQFWEGIALRQMIRNGQHWAYRLEQSIVTASFQTKVTVAAIIVIASGTFFLRKMRED